MFNRNLPTPKSMTEALRHGMLIGPMREMEQRTWWCMRDYLAQKFGVAMMEAANAGNANLELKLEALFKEIVGEEPTVKKS